VQRGKVIAPYPAMIRVTAERNKGLQVVVKERLSRPAVHELRKTCDGHSAGGLSAVFFC